VLLSGKNAGTRTRVRDYKQSNASLPELIQINPLRGAQRQSDINEVGAQLIKGGLL
jgi:hypothetical protein